MVDHVGPYGAVRRPASRGAPAHGEGHECGPEHGRHHGDHRDLEDGLRQGARHQSEHDADGCDRGERHSPEPGERQVVADRSQGGGSHGIAVATCRPEQRRDDEEQAEPEDSAEDQAHPTPPASTISGSKPDDDELRGASGATPRRHELAPVSAEDQCRSRPRHPSSHRSARRSRGPAGCRRDRCPGARRGRCSSRRSARRRPSRCCGPRGAGACRASRARPAPSWRGSCTCRGVRSSGR